MNIKYHFTPEEELFLINKDFLDFKKWKFITYFIRDNYYFQVNKFGERIFSKPLDNLHIRLMEDCNIITKLN